MPDASDPFGGLTGADRDAALAIQSLFAQYGLGTLAPKIVDFIKQGYSADTITILLQDTSEYKKRFAANDARRAAGLPVLSPAEYLATESAYRQVMKEAGVPAGFYDQPDDFTSWLGADVSPTEIKGRVDAASQMVNSLDKNTLDEFKKYYSTGDIIAFALDQKRAAPLVGKAFEAAKIGGAAVGQGLQVDKNTAEQLAGAGINKDQAQQGFGMIASDQANVNKLADIGGQAHLTQSDLINEVFFSNANVADQRKKLASQERGRFSGTSGVGTGSLATNAGGGPL